MITKTGNPKISVLQMHYRRG